MHLDARWTNILNENRERGAIQYVGPVLLSERLVVISSEGRLEEYSPFDGSFLGSTRVGDPVSLPPIVANGTLYIYSDDADLIAFRGDGIARCALVLDPQVVRTEARPKRWCAAWSRPASERWF